MRSFEAEYELATATLETGHSKARLYPALSSFTDEVVGTMARLIAYVMGLTLIATAGLFVWCPFPDFAEVEPEAKAGWSEATRSAPAFAVSSFDSKDETETYRIYRHPGGGRKDVFRWSDQAEGPVAELEIYRPGGELDRSPAPMADIAARLDPDGTNELETAGIIESKFGPVTLLRQSGGVSTQTCLGFLSLAGETGLRLSGWSCRGDSLAARRAGIGCVLNRLTLLAAGNEPRLAEMFAHAELKRTDCAGASVPALSADWVMGSESPSLRGAL